MSQPYRTRMELINQFGNGRFARTEPKEWRHVPFAGKVRILPRVRNVILWAIFYVALFGIGLLAIAQSGVK